MIPLLTEIVCPAWSLKVPDWPVLLLGIDTISETKILLQYCPEVPSVRPCKEEVGTTFPEKDTWEAAILTPVPRQFSILNKSGSELPPSS